MNWHCLHFRDISAEVLHDLVALRIAVFVVEQNCPYPELDGKDKFCYHVFGVDENGVVQACARIVPPGISYPEPSIGRVCTSGAVRGAGTGKELMKQVMNCLKLLYGNTPVRISAQEYLIKFYQDLGFSLTGKSYLEDDIPHVEMLAESIFR